MKLSRSNPVLKQKEITNYLENFQQKFILAPFDKASNNVAIICKKYVEIILKKCGIYSTAKYAQLK